MNSLRFLSSTSLKRSLCKSHIDRVSANIKQVPVAQVESKILSQVSGRFTGFHLLDVRETHEWNESHIPGAIYIGRGNLERDIEALVPDTADEIVCYCLSGKRSVLAAEALARMGYINVASLEGGIAAWKDRGLKLEETLPSFSERLEGYYL